jgi:hypothetical protein
MFGTSASAPVFAAMISLLNSVRFAHGMPAVGFILPTLYAFENREQYIDITSGSNHCGKIDSYGEYECCMGGFSCAEGWDPVTGLGTLKYTSLLAMFELPTPAPTPLPSFAPSAAVMSKIPTVAPSELLVVMTYVNMVGNLLNLLMNMIDIVLISFVLIGHVIVNKLSKVDFWN